MVMDYRMLESLGLGVLDGAFFFEGGSHFFDPKYLEVHG